MTLAKIRNLIVPALLTTGIVVLSALLMSSAGRPQLDAAELRHEIGLYRPIEAQLSGAKHYSPCEAAELAVDRVPWARCRIEKAVSNASIKDLFRAAAKIGGSDPWTSGLTYLLWAKNPESLERALENLEKAHSQAPHDPARANDLAAALIERAGQENQPVDLVAALDLLEEALRDKPETPWLLFNRALVLERLQLLSLASRAWLHYLDDNPTSPWEPEAQAHSAKLNTYAAAQAEPVNEHLLEAAKRVDTVRLSELADRHPREAREFAVELALQQWGEAMLAGHKDEAGHWRDALRTLGEELVRLGGDHTVLEAVEEIEAVQGRSEEERELASSYQLYGKGHQLFQKRDYLHAAPLLVEAQAQLATIGSPIAGWALLDLGAVQLYKNRSKAAVALFAPLLDSCDVSRYPSLCGRTAWGKGLGLFRLGRLAEAITAYRTSAAAFLPTREKDNRAGALGLIAETLRELGDTSSAWQYRYQSLRVLGGQTRHRSNHNLLWEGGEAALEEGYPLAAELFADEDVELFGGGPDRLLALESYLRRAQLRRGRVPSSIVLADLDRAVAISHELPNSPLLPRIEADVQLALAQVAVEGAPHQAEAVLGQTFKFFQSHGLVLREAATLLIEARLAKAQGNILHVKGHLKAAVNLFEARRTQLAGEDQRLYSETWNGTYDELIELAAMRPDGAEDALRLLEHSRGNDMHQGRIFPAMDPATVILTFAVHPSALYRFQIEGRKLSLNKFPIARLELATKVNEFVDSIRLGSSAKDASVELSRLLIPTDLAEGAIICFVPDRELSGVPFSALPLPDNPAAPLVTRHKIVLSNSVDDCRAASYHLTLDSNNGKMLLVSSPKLDRKEFPLFLKLPGAMAETAALLQLYPNFTLLANENATVPALLQALPNAAVLHFAGHAVAHPTDPRRSFLPLAPDSAWPQASLLSAADIEKLHLPNLELAILSACGTLESSSRRAGSLSGLVRALLDAGARNVLGALWNIEDQPSDKFFIEFHRRFRSTSDAASALRDTQIDFLNSKSKKFNHPSTWAAFELFVRPSSNQEVRKEYLWLSMQR